MSEFKFACPVCCQHITADSSSAGSQITCPTCFQKLVVPQAPASPDSKFIVTAAQVSKPRPIPADSGSNGPVPAPSTGVPLLAAIATIVVLGAIGAGLWVFRGKLFKPATQDPEAKETAHETPAQTPPKVYPIPTNILWSLDLTNAEIPAAVAAGSVHGKGFYCERAMLQGGTLNLRQGPKWPPDLGLTIELHAHQGEELSGKTVEITPDREPPVPRVTVRWKDDALKAMTEKINQGYALKLTFGEAANSRIPGKIYICLPDEAKSVIAGTFNAQIRKASPPKNKKQKPG